jgi:hypothetical protein
VKPADAADRLRKAEWDVRPVSLAIAEDLIGRLHYSQGGANTKTYLHGLFRRDDPARVLGVAWWIPPTKSAALATYPTDWQGVLSLSRLAIEDEVPKNAASFLLARSCRLIDRLRWPCFVTYADEWQGHRGTIYLAAGWTFVGKTAPEPTWVKEGRMVARKAGPKTRTAKEMRELGAVCVESFSRLKFVKIAAGAPLVSRPQLDMFVA